MRGRRDPAVCRAMWLTDELGTRLVPRLQKPKFTWWDKAGHYHGLLLEQCPPHARRALDVGCGAGAFARKLATRVEQVVGLDQDPPIIRDAIARSNGTNPSFVATDLLSYEADEPFDFVTCVVALHHMPVSDALRQMRQLLAPGGVLAVLGIARRASPIDYLVWAAALPLDVAAGAFRSRELPPFGQLGNAKVIPPDETLAEIRRAAAAELPGGAVHRRLYSRYTLFYEARP